MSNNKPTVHTDTVSCFYCEHSYIEMEDSEFGSGLDYAVCDHPDVDDEIFDDGDEALWPTSCGHFEHKKMACAACKKNITMERLYFSIWGPVAVCGDKCALKVQAADDKEIAAL